MRRVAYIPRPTDDTVRLMIYKSDNEIYVFGFDSLADTESKWDYVYDDLEDAVEFCYDTYNVDNDKWIDIEDPFDNCQHDWIERTRTKGREKGQEEWGKYEQLLNGRWTHIPKADKLTSFDGMTGNERLFVTGLMTEFDRSKSTNKRNAEKILKALQWDEASVKQILQ